ncbi:hypothetical protein O3P69_005765 [Scylla paramamosain]|uniref:Uncharacterized protein n=1 Tax=Scylla paramamosain TaxID=85552 RepID=A0AAW0UAY6_SCYPA
MCCTCRYSGWRLRHVTSGAGVLSHIAPHHTISASCDCQQGGGERYTGGEVGLEIAIVYLVARTTWPDNSHHHHRSTIPSHTPAGKSVPTTVARPSTAGLRGAYSEGNLTDLEMYGTGVEGLRGMGDPLPG